MFARLVALCALVTVGAAVPTHHAEPALTGAWTTSAVEVKNLQSDVRVIFQVRERNHDAIKNAVVEISDPDHPRYGQFLSKQEVDEITAPAADDISTVRTWLESAPGATLSLMRQDGRTVAATMPLASAETLFQTKFRLVTNSQTGQQALRASDFALPPRVAAATGALFGLHGLPIPPRSVTVDAPAKPAKPANVTPAVITKQYGIAGVKVDRSGSNRQAVAEFQGQTMSSIDLTKFFKQFVPDASAGDDTVSKFVGDPGDKSGATEASLDIQYIMGIAPGVKTEFWLYNPSDFCADLKNWTTTMLADEQLPFVFSVSYGWQGNLTQIGCKPDEVDAVDSDFAKLASRGVSIIFASGDSGSGYNTGSNRCQGSYSSGIAFTGTKERTSEAEDSTFCCAISGGSPFTYSEGSGPSVQQCPTLPVTKNQQLEGQINRWVRIPAHDTEVCCELSIRYGGVGWTMTPIKGQRDLLNCTLYNSVTGHSSATGATSGTHAKAVPGTCTTFSEVTGNTTSKGSVSGNSGTKNIVLWPSWPASSPWVTAVGATRFVDQKPGNEEMATDQFGSGGGFSAQFGQSPNAEWQTSDVKNYLQVVPKGAPFPPSGSFPATGRATPDVAALGEGFQVVQGPSLLTVGGTSASAPTFAAVVSLLNEARLQAGKKQLGFLNTFLYKNQDAFTDVTKGTNAIGRGTGPIKFGYNCTSGWDPATGMGTPAFSALLKAAMAAP